MVFLSCSFVIPDPIVDGVGNEGKAGLLYTGLSKGQSS
jgi:hypothetical protein